MLVSRVRRLRFRGSQGLFKLRNPDSRVRPLPEELQVDRGSFMRALSSKGLDLQGFKAGAGGAGGSQLWMVGCPAC